MIFANVFPKGAATLLRIAILGLSATGIFAAGYAPASADMQGWWNVWGVAGVMPYGYDSYYKANWAVFSSTGQAYMLYRDGLRGSGATVVALSGGTTWTTVGTPAFSSGATSDGHMAVAPDGTLYVAYRDDANWGVLAVKKFNGTSWIDFGSSAFSQFTPSFWSKISIAPDGTPYINLIYNGYFGVYRYTGGSWQAVGATITISAGSFVEFGSSMSDLAFAPNGTPYVVLNNGHWLRVLAYSGGSWTQVGPNVNGTDDGVDYSTITVGNDGSVYVLSMDKSGGSTSLGKLMRYNGSSWSQVWSNIASPSGISAPGFAKGNDGTIYFRLYNYVTNRGEVYSVNGSSLTLLDASIPNEAGGGGLGQLLVNPANGALYTVGEWVGNNLRMTWIFMYSNLRSSGSDIGVGINWSGTGTITTKSLAFDSTGTGYVSFIDHSASNNTTVMRRGADGIWTRLGAAGAIPTGTGSTFFSASYLAVGPDNVPYVLFKDASNTSWHARISLVKWNGTAWVYVGGGGLSSGQANPTQLNFSSDGKPYVTYRDISSGYVAARYFDGSAWQNLGSTETIVSYTSSVGFGSFAANGDFYVALYDGSPATGKGPTVVRWNGTAWSQVGSGRIGTYAANTNGAGPQGIYVGSDGRPRIIATDMSTATTVPAVYMWKYDGSNWVREGSEIGKFSPAARVEAAPNGKIYVMYIETTDRGTTATVSYPITIKQFVGSDWVTVGSSYFDVTKNISMIAINPANNVPYLPIITQNSKVSVISPLQVLNSSTSVSANISAGAIEVGTPASIAFPSTTVSSSIQTLDFAGGVFTVEDLKWSNNGYYVTISVGNFSNGSSTISATNISARVSAPVTRIAGGTNSAVSVPNTAGTIGAGYVPINSATTLVQRSSAGGILGKYGVSLDLRMSIPAYVPAGTYSGTMTITLMEN